MAFSDDHFKIMGISAGGITALSLLIIAIAASYHAYKTTG